MYYFFKAFLVGLALAAVFGPASVLFVQKTLKIGIRGAVVVGAGISFANMVYGLIAGVGMNSIVHILTEKMIIIKTIGGFFLLYLAMKELFQKQIKIMDDKIESLSHTFLQAFFITLTSPAAIITFISMFASIGGKDVGLIESLLMVMGVFLGSVVWVIFLGALVLFLRTRLSELWLSRTRYFSALVLGGFGLFTLYSAL